MTGGAGRLRGRPGTWWRVKNTPAKVETYTRGSFHFFAVIEIAVAGLPVLGRFGDFRGAVLVLLVCAHAAVCVPTVSRAVDWVRGRRGQPVRLMWTLAALTGVVAVTALGVARYGGGDEAADAAAGTVFGVVVIFGTGIITLGVRERRQVYAIVAAGGSSAGLLTMAATGSPVGMLVTGSIVLFSAGFLAFTAVFSVWLLQAVYELDAARETRARLAVAEERLRFGRDLHDVLGRNLAVIALKSELAVRLARGGRTEAVEQMIEVQRIARESQQEVRAVVRGYREADLYAELVGARGVLTAAGIACEVRGEVADLPGEVQSALAWVVREAATNVLPHGNAGRCLVDVGVSGEHVVLTVENDGVSDIVDPGGGSGLAGLRERLASVDGTLEAGRVGEGLFRLVARVPSTSRVGEVG